MGNSESVWKEIKRKTNAKGGNPASPRNPKKSVRQAARKWISARPRGTYQKYTRAFLWHDKVFHRLGDDRLPIKEIYGPNIARELAKPDVVAVWEQGLNGLNKRIGYELYRELFTVYRK